MAAFRAAKLLDDKQLRTVGMAVSAFMPVDPPLVGICIRGTSSAWSLAESRQL